MVEAETPFPDSNDVQRAAGPWRINTAHALSWRSWDGEMVIYDDLSGDTLKLEVLMAEAFRHLQQAPATRAELTAYLAQTFELEDDTRMALWATRMIERFEKAGLIERATAPGVLEPDA